MPEPQITARQRSKPRTNQSDSDVEVRLCMVLFCRGFVLETGPDVLELATTLSSQRLFCWPYVGLCWWGSLRSWMMQTFWYGKLLIMKPLSLPWSSRSTSFAVNVFRARRKQEQLEQRHTCKSHRHHRAQLPTDRQLTIPLCLP